MPITVRSVNDAKKEVYSRRIVFLALMDLDTDSGKQMLQILNKLERIFRKYMSFIVLHVKDCEPSISLFFEGREILRQSAFFGNVEKDYNALRMSLWSVLKDYNIEKRGTSLKL